MVGTTVGKYRVLERIGRGGMGIVYKAVDETLDRFVAIKVLNAEFGDAAVLKRFRAEAITLARLSHPGIAVIYELHRQDDELMMVMEYLRGETLHELAERIGPLEPPQAAHLCMQVLDALSHAHRAGIIHRDLKPANVMVTETGAVKVMDFGIARVLGSEQYTLGGLTMGTPAYMAPEQVTGQAIDARADLYAIGVLFYRLLSGRLPFVADTAIAMAQKQVSDQPTPLSEIRPDLPAWCTAIINRALAKDPVQRYQSAEDFRAGLATAVVPQSLGELETLATPTLGTGLPPLPSDRTRATAEPDAAAIPTTQLPREQTSTTVVLGRSHVFLLAALFVALTAGIVVLGVSLFRNQTRPETETVPPPAAAAPNGSAPAAVETAVPPPAPVAPSSVPPAVTSIPATVPPGASRGVDPTAKPALPKPPPPVGGAPLPAVPAGSKPAGAAPPPATPAATEAPTPEPAPAAPASSLPTAAFGGVKMLVTSGERLRERSGVLRIGNGEITITDGSSSRVLTSVSAVTGIHFSRSKQPRWRDDAGKEAGTRVDLGRFGFFRGDRNWLILTTDGEPVILSVDDPQVRPVVTALEARTGRTIKRFQ